MKGASLIDSFLASGVLVICLPVIGVIALAIKLDSAGPVFRRQDRVRRDGKAFKLLKFRTIKGDTAGAIGTVLAEKDERLTRVGRVILKLQLDKIPQIINVLRGETGFAGPGPTSFSQLKNKNISLQTSF